jgi:hypothetical protein
MNWLDGLLEPLLDRLALKLALKVRAQLDGAIDAALDRADDRINTPFWVLNARLPAATKQISDLKAAVAPVITLQQQVWMPRGFGVRSGQKLQRSSSRRWRPLPRRLDSQRIRRLRRRSKLPG